MRGQEVEAIRGYLKVSKLSSFEGSDRGRKTLGWLLEHATYTEAAADEAGE